MRRPIEYPRLNFDYKLNGPEDDTRKNECSRCCNDTLVTEEELQRRLCTHCYTHCELCENQLHNILELRTNVCNDCRNSDSDMLED